MGGLPEGPTLDATCRGPALPGVHGFHTGKRAWGDSVGDGWRMKDTDSSSGAIIPTLFWGRLGLNVRNWQVTCPALLQGHAP